MRRAVVCDRDELTRRAVSGILADNGFEVVGTTGDAREAVAMTRDQRPDVIVLGVAPGTDDLKALAEITGQRTAPVVVLAAESTPEQVAGARDAGALAYLTKPPSLGRPHPRGAPAISRTLSTSARLASSASPWNRGKYVRPAAVRLAVGAAGGADRAGEQSAAERGVGHQADAELARTGGSRPRGRG